MMVVTKHAGKRIKKRAGIGKDGVERIAKKALNEGITHSQTNGTLKKYLDKIYFKYQNANGLRIYGHFVFVFHGSILITMWAIPTKFIAHVDKIRRRLSNDHLGKCNETKDY
jgi:hypothetical protein